MACCLACVLALAPLFGCGTIIDVPPFEGAGTSPASPVPASYFGLSTGDFVDLSPTLPFGTTRSWDAHQLDWSDANPAPGVYNFSALDSFIQFSQQHNSEIIYTFGRTPRWASSEPNAATPYGPGQCAPPVSIASWDNYVRAIVTHAAGQIKYWELWNEPQDSQFYCGDIPTMIVMAQHANQIIKSIDPSAQILSPATVGSGGPAWLNSFLAGGGSQFIDVIAFHGYQTGTAEDIVSTIAGYNAVMKANHAGNKQLWDTEASWAQCDNQGTQRMDQKVAFIPKYYLLQWSQGVPRFVWYAYDGGTWGGLETNGVESPAATSFKQTFSWLVGASLARPCSEDKAGTWSCALARPNNYAGLVLWNSANTVSFAVPAQYTQYRDLAGAVHPLDARTITITSQPVLLETGPIQ
jgi:hypothetical protein